MNRKDFGMGEAVTIYSGPHAGHSGVYVEGDLIRGDRRYGIEVERSVGRLIPEKIVLWCSREELIEQNTKRLLMSCALFSDYHDIETGESYNTNEKWATCSRCHEATKNSYESDEGIILCADCIEIVTMKNLADCWRENSGGS